MFQQWDYGVKLAKEQEIRERIQRAQVERLVESVQPRRDRSLARLLRCLGGTAEQILLKLAFAKLPKSKHTANQAPETRHVWTPHLRGG